MVRSSKVGSFHSLSGRTAETRGRHRWLAAARPPRSPRLRGGVDVGQTFGDPAVGEEVLVEPGVRHLVQHQVGVEILSDLDLVDPSTYHPAYRGCRARTTG
jgi:hypothetical protein